MGSRGLRAGWARRRTRWCCSLRVHLSDVTVLRAWWTWARAPGVCKVRRAEADGRARGAWSRRVLRRGQEDTGATTATTQNLAQLSTGSSILHGTGIVTVVSRCGLYDTIIGFHRRCQVFKRRKADYKTSNPSTLHYTQNYPLSSRRLLLVRESSRSDSGCSSSGCSIGRGGSLPLLDPQSLLVCSVYSSVPIR
jgi:hypothetical protein